MVKGGNSDDSIFLNDWRANLFSDSLTKYYPVALRYPKRTRKLVKPIADRDDSTCPHAEASWEAFRLQKKEERYIAMVTTIPLAILLLPAFAMIVYLILNPDAFMVPISP